MRQGRGNSEEYAEGLMKDFPYIWAWGPGKVGRLPGRKGQRCRVLIRGKRNSCLIEFEDGFRAITSRSEIRLSPARSRLGSVP